MGIKFTKIYRQSAPSATTSLFRLAGVEGMGLGGVGMAGAARCCS